jgi:excisionase family DNA binding protein
LAFGDFANFVDVPVSLVSEPDPNAGDPARDSRAPRTPALALSIKQACDALGVSWDTWQEHIAHEVKIVRIGRRKLVPVRELERWLEEHAETTLPGAA